MARSFSTCFDTFKPKNSFIFPGLEEETLFAAYSLKRFENQSLWQTLN